VTSVSGPSLDTRAMRDGAVTLTVLDASRRRHQFLIALERSRGDGSFKADSTLPTVPGAQREVGEVAVEATGTVEVDASGDEGLRRMDVRETHPSLRSLASRPLLAAFRYQRRQNETRTLALDVKRFADAPVIAAVAEHATATTLVTSEGRTLTEVQLTLRNRAQPFMKVTLPPGATMLSVEVAGETAKPVTASDGTRVPLLRAGFRPNGPYTVSFVYLHAGAAFAKRGDAQMILPSLDVPISVLEWELFLPDRFSAKASGGNVIPAHLVDTLAPEPGSARLGAAGGQAGGWLGSRGIGAGQVVGRITDTSGGVIPGATVTVQGPGAGQAAVSDGDGFTCCRTCHRERARPGRADRLPAHRAAFSSTSVGSSFPARRSRDLGDRRSAGRGGGTRAAGAKRGQHHPTPGAGAVAERCQPAAEGGRRAAGAHRRAARRHRVPLRASARAG
jgi:hypothetical protein